mgnify:CR=1 FL=1
MDTVQSYKCPCCGAPLAFDGTTQSLRCASCVNEFSAETLQQLSETEQPGASQYDWQQYSPRSFEDTGEVDLSGYSCPSCGAEITGDATLGATTCPYCGNATIVKGQFEGTLRPDYLIPFRVNKDAAIHAFEADFKNAPFLPDLFRDKQRIAEMSGVYVPFWTFDCDCDASINYDAQQTTMWSDSKYDYVKTDHYRLLRSGSVGFANIPVDGSKKADDAYMEAVEPYDYSEAVDFNAAYLSGYLADKYDVSAEESIARANERVKNSTESVFRQTTSTYESVVASQSSIRFSGGKIRYALLPVWMLNIKYLDKMYAFAINGQTGKVVGEYPVDQKKKWGYFAKIAGIAYVAAAAVAWLLLH